MRLLGQKIEVLQAVSSAHAHLSPQQPITAQQEPAVPDYTWKIANFTRKLAEANSNNDYGEIESEPFFSSHGYKMRVTTNLNEGPNGKSGYMGVYIQLIKGDQDGSLPWPFTEPITFDLVDQQDDPSKRQNISETLIPEGQREFKRPRQRENEGWGYDQFVKHSTLRTRQYIRDHAVYIKVFIDRFIDA